MGHPASFDVIIVGAGPGGSVAAKRCARNGFKTLLLEKRGLPREKVCTGMVMGPWAQGIMREEFGDIPGRILVSPHHLSGHLIHLPGVEPRKIEWRTPLAWRRDLDFWMNQGAAGEGVEIWDRSRVVGVSPHEGTIDLTLKRGKERVRLQTTFLIGADGATSAVRKSLFPDLRVPYSAPIRVCYEGALDLDRDSIHWFFPNSRPRPRFDLIHKGECFLIEGSGIRELRDTLGDILADYGFDPRARPLWKDGCLEPLLHGPILSGAFSPARGNVLLVGDAAGLIFPITFEGIGAALRSGLAAAHAVLLGARTGRDPARIYLHELKPVLEVIENLYGLQERLKAEASQKGPEEVSEALRQAYEATFRIA